MLTGLEFKYPLNGLYFILAVAAVVFFVLSFRKKEKIMALLHLPDKMRMKALRTALLLVSLGLIVFSLMGPQVFEGYAQVQKTGLDIYVLVDTSKSMLVSDIKPDRISVAKKIVENLLNNLDGDRVGFIPFASDAYIQLPLTDDYPLARMFLDVMDTDMISGGGTNLAAALKLANDSFKRTADSDSVILILSDGEEHDDASLTALQNMTDGNVKIFSIGIGTEKGGLVPVYSDSGDTIVDYMKDEAGNPVTSRLHADTLKKLAKEGNGAYYQYQASLQQDEVGALLNELAALQKGTLAEEKVKQFQQLYQYFLGAGIVLFLLAWFLPERRAVS